MQLMCHLSIDKVDIGSRFGIEFDRYFSDDIAKLDEFIADGLIENNNTHVLVTGRGKLVVRNIAMCFDAYLEKMTSQKPVFSKTV